VVRAAYTLLAAGLALITIASRQTMASSWWWWSHENSCAPSGGAGCDADSSLGVVQGSWYWLHSPEEERRITMGLYNRYCIRCHGVDGRGIWDIPNVPDFTDASWQACRTDAQIVRAILEGRRWCMPPFRLALTSTEALSMAHYLRTFVPGTEISRPSMTTNPPR
jgi:hypothetical protein